MNKKHQSHFAVLFFLISLGALGTCFAETSRVPPELSTPLGEFVWRNVTPNTWVTTIEDSRTGNTTVMLAVGETESIIKMERACHKKSTPERVVWNVSDESGILQDCEGVFRDWNLPVVKNNLISALPKEVREHIQQQKKIPRSKKKIVNTGLI